LNTTAAAKAPGIIVQVAGSGTLLAGMTPFTNPIEAASTLNPGGSKKAT
jgi:hypothetical protein